MTRKKSKVNLWSVGVEKFETEYGLKEEKAIEDYSTQLREQIKKLEKMISETQRATNTIKITDDRPVRISKRKNGYQYYLEKKDGKLEYIRTSDIDKVKQIVQRDYNKVLLDKLLTMKYRIERFLKIYDISSIEDVYNNLSDARKALVKPLIPTDEQFISEWRSRNRGGMNPFPEEGIYQTIRGERVRSKSEKILADLFARYEIPYSYEPKVVLHDGRTMYPDFVLLNVRTRKTIYWEHFGLITDGEYAKNALSKLNLYDQAGIDIGKDLLISMESPKIPLNLKHVEKKIREYLI